MRLIKIVIKSRCKRAISKPQDFSASITTWKKARKREGKPVNKSKPIIKAFANYTPYDDIYANKFPANIINEVGFQKMIQTSMSKEILFQDRNID